MSKDQFFLEQDKMEKRIGTYMREQCQAFSEQLVDQKSWLEVSLANFDKQIKDYRSQVLWRIKDCEELLKSRVTTQELNDKIKSLEIRITAKQEIELTSVNERLKKSFETCLNRVKTSENYVTDKLFDIKEYIKVVDEKVAGMAN